MVRHLLQTSPRAVNVPRCHCLKDERVAGGASWIASTARGQVDQASRPVVVGIMGLNRGQALAEVFARQPGVDIRYVCDVDQRRVAACVGAVTALQKSPVQAVGDFRQILDDPHVEVLVCAAPNHWHAPATILGCQAGKHVYVEKPCSHNPWEGE